MSCADEAGSTITLGYSSGSKVWANQNMQIPTLLDWCRELGDKIADESKFQTGSQLDQLSAGERVGRFPEGPIAVDWHLDAYKHSFRMSYSDTSGTSRDCDAMDCDLRVVAHGTDEKLLHITLSLPSQDCTVDYRLGKMPFFSYAKTNAATVMVQRKDEEVDLMTYLNNYPFAIFFCDFSRVSGEELFTAPKDYEPFQRSSIIEIDWDKKGVDIQGEFGGGAKSAKKSIHTYLKDTLVNEDVDIVFYDHGTGEIADLVTVKKDKKQITISMYHCKGSGDSAPGDRVADVYEVCGQVVKSMLWLERMELLLTRVRRRVERGSVFLKGEMKTLEVIVEAARLIPVRYRICLVQPGISAANITPKNLHVLAAAHEYVRGAQLQIWSSWHPDKERISSREFAFWRTDFANSPGSLVTMATPYAVNAASEIL